MREDSLGNTTESHDTVSTRTTIPAFNVKRRPLEATPLWGDFSWPLCSNEHSPSEHHKEQMCRTWGRGVNSAFSYPAIMYRIISECPLVVETVTLCLENMAIVGMNCEEPPHGVAAMGSGPLWQ